MNIENHFNNAEAYLEMANEKVSHDEFDSALAALAKAYSNVRTLIELVYVMQLAKQQEAFFSDEDSK